MRTYEIVIVARPDLRDEDFESLLDTVKGWVEAAQGEVSQIDRWGRRRLAYTIAKQREGQYVLLRAQLPSAAPAELERNLRINENVLRFLISREDD